MLAHAVEGGVPCIIYQHLPPIFNLGSLCLLLSTLFTHIRLLGTLNKYVVHHKRYQASLGPPMRHWLLRSMASPPEQRLERANGPDTRRGPTHSPWYQ